MAQNWIFADLFWFGNDSGRSFNVCHLHFPAIPANETSFRVALTICFRLFVFPLPLFALSHLGFRLRLSIPCLFTSCLFLTLFYFISLSLFFLIYSFSVRVCFLDGPSGFHGIGAILPQVMTFQSLDGSPCSQSIPIQSKTLSRVFFWAASFTRF
jgi:hypothetical protein